MIQTAKLTQLATSRHGSLAALVAAAILVVLIFIQLYSVSDLFFFSAKLKPTSKQAISLPLQSQKAHPIAQSHLFGRYQAKDVNAQTLPDSLLNVKLAGVFMATPQQRSKAVIVVPGNEQRVYRVGDTIVAGSKLYRVLSNSVIIERDGQLEKLRLPRTEINFDREPSPLNLDKGWSRNNFLI